MASGAPAHPSDPGGAPGPTATRLPGLGNALSSCFGRELFPAAVCRRDDRLDRRSGPPEGGRHHGVRPPARQPRVLAEHGLGAEGRNALGDGASCPWDIPLRGLRNRRISVIEGRASKTLRAPALIKTLRQRPVRRLPADLLHYEPTGGPAGFCGGQVGPSPTRSCRR